MAKKSTKKKTRSKRGANKTPSTTAWWQRFIGSSVGKWLIAVAATVAVVVIDTLIAGQNMSLFLLLVGIELLVFTVVIWTYLLFGRTAPTE
ncbi:MAG: hypothetical protein ACOYH4_07105 [Saccharofermentanales bacterium]